MNIKSDYIIGERLTLKDGRRVTIKGLHLYINADGVVGYHLHIGGARFINPREIERRGWELCKNQR